MVGVAPGLMSEDERLDLADAALALRRQLIPFLPPGTCVRPALRLPPDWWQRGERRDHRRRGMKIWYSYMD